MQVATMIRGGTHIFKKSLQTKSTREGICKSGSNNKPFNVQAAALTFHVSSSTQDPVSVSADCANGQDIRASYEISYNNSSGTSITTCIVNGIDCSNGVCHHELQNNIADYRCQPQVPQFHGESVTVTVTSRNIVGRSNPAVSRSIGEL